MTNQQGAFHRIFYRGQKKVFYRPRQSALIMSLSDEDHRRIAKLIGQWLAETNASDRDNKHHLK